MNITEEDSGKYKCSAVFEIKPTESQVELKVLTFAEPLKPFVAIAVEVVVLITLILLYERHSQKQKGPVGSTGRLIRQSDSVCLIHSEQTYLNKYLLEVCFILNNCLILTSQRTDCMNIHREYIMIALDQITAYQLLPNKYIAFTVTK